MLILGQPTPFQFAPLQAPPQMSPPCFSSFPKVGYSCFSPATKGENKSLTMISQFIFSERDYLQEQNSVWDLDCCFFKIVISATGELTLKLLIYLRSTADELEL